MDLKWKLSIKDKLDKLDTPNKVENFSLKLFFGKDENLNCNKIFNTKKMLNANLCMLYNTIGRVRDN